MIAPAYKEQRIKDLKPYDRNARTHSSAQVEKLAKSIATFGFTNPVIVDEDGGIIAGHGRVMAAKKLKLTSIPTIVVAGLTQELKKALVIADNKLALDAGWDTEILYSELMSLNTPDFDFGLTGFTLDEATLLALDTSTITDERVPGEGEGSQDDGLLAMCRELLKDDPGFPALVRDRHAKLGA